jgi:hypothetical protein
MSKYNLRYPVSQKPLYKSSDNVQFTLSFPNEALAGKKRISGLLDVYSTGTTRIASEKIYYDNLCGIHSFIGNVIVSCQTKGILENQIVYSRSVKMKNSATKCLSQVVSDSKSLNELLCSDYTQTNLMMNQQLPFSFEIDCCLNNVNDNTNIPYNKTGDITIEFRIAQAFEALFGSDMTNNVNFTLSNLACEYFTVPLEKGTDKTYMLWSHQVKQPVNSVNTVLNIKIPANISRVSCSFLPISKELTLPYNGLELEKPTGIYKLFYSFNDSTNAFITYPIETQEDMLEHYLDSFIRMDDKHSGTLKKINDNKFFGVGLNFEEYVNMASSSFGINILSKVQSSAPYYIYMCFTGLVEF